jgi:hypothetical protein
MVLSLRKKLNGELAPGQSVFKPSKNVLPKEELQIAFIPQHAHL